MKRNISVTAAAFIFGIAGFFIRTRQLANAYDDAGLHVTPDPWGTALIILCIAAAAVILLLSYFVKNRENVELEGNILGVGISGLGAVVLAAYCVVSLLSFTQTRDTLSNLIFPIFGLMTVLCTAVFSAGVYKGAHGNRLAAAGAIPVFFGCLWLIVCYRSNAIEPTISLFAYELLAIIFTVIGMCIVTQSKIYEKNYFLALPLPAIGLFLSLITLADSRSGFETLLFVYAAVEMACGSLLAQGGTKIEVVSE